MGPRESQDLRSPSPIMAPAEKVKQFLQRLIIHVCAQSRRKHGTIIRIAVLMGNRIIFPIEKRRCF